MTTDSSFDRRQYDRVSCRPPLEASFLSSEGIFSAFVEDISPAGARLRIPFSNQRIPFLLQGELSYTFHSKTSDSQYQGKTAWVQRVNTDFVWGIEFISVEQCVGDRIGTTAQNAASPVG